MRETKIKINQIDYDFDTHGGGAKSVELLSITTAPQPPFPAESRYYNSNENVIYKAIVDNTWENAETFNPEVGVLYTYDSETYLYDGKLNSLFKIGDSTSSSELFIINKTLPANTVILDTEIDFSKNFLINVYVNGLLQTRDEHYYIENNNIVFTSTFEEAVNVIIIYTSSSDVNIDNPPTGAANYNELINKPKINNVIIYGNLNSDDLNLQNKITQDNKLSTDLITGLSTVATSGSYNDLSDKPQLSNVAITGNYEDLTNKPIIDSILNNTSENAIQNKVVTNAINNETTNRQDADDNLQSQINQLESRGRFLSLWDCTTGLPETNPTISPYTYKTGDYYIVGNVNNSNSSSDINYKPNGSSYITGVASTVVETGDVQVNDVYYYDGTNWALQENHNKEISFSEITGNPNDNINLANALEEKQDTLISGSNIKTINGNSLIGSGNVEVTTYQSFNPNWYNSESYTTLQFCDSINSDSNAIIGMAYIGTLKCSDIPITPYEPSQIKQGDAIVKIIGQEQNSKIILIELSSSTEYPYKWEFTYHNHITDKGWIGFQPELPKQDGNDGKYLTTDGTSLSWGEVDLSSKQDKLIAGENIKIENNVISSAVTAFGSSINLKYENIVVSNWIVDNSFQDFIYKADIDCLDVTSDMYAIVNYSYEDSTSGNYSNVCETSQDIVSIWSSVNTPITIPSIVAFGFANVVTFIVKNSSNNPINSATINIGDFVLSTDSEGVARATNIPNGLYTYTISADMYETKTGTINIYNNSLTVSETLLLIPIDAYAAESVVLGNAVKLNAGVGDSDQDYNVYASNTAITNDLTLDAVAASTTSAGSVTQVELANPNNMNITVQALDENNAPIDADIEFNNSNEIDEVNFVIEAKDIYLAFNKGADIIYFKNDTTPFIPMSDKTFESKSYTYYTYESNVMVSHNATTSSVTADGANTYDGTTLNIDTSDTFSDGIWRRYPAGDLEIDDNSATITTSSYLTTPQVVIPRSDNFIFRVEKLNPAVWDTKIIVGGQERKVINLQEMIVKSNQLIEIYATKHNSDKMIDTYNKYFYISNDKTYKKVNFIISSSEANSTFKFTINGIVFTYTGSTANIDVYEGETVNWELSKTGFITQSGSYSVPSYPTIKTYDAGTKILVSE